MQLVSDSQRESILSLVKKGMDSREIATQLGGEITPGMVAAIKAHFTRGTYEKITDGGAEEEEVAKAFDTTFGLERDLQMALRNSIEQLGPGLTIIDGGHEQTVTSGRIDITARDKDGWTVVIELKASTAERDAIGQILSYTRPDRWHYTGARHCYSEGLLAAGDLRCTGDLQCSTRCNNSVQFKFGTISTAAEEP